MKKASSNIKLIQRNKHRNFQIVNAIAFYQFFKKSIEKDGVVYYQVELDGKGEVNVMFSADGNGKKIFRTRIRHEKQSKKYLYNQNHLSYDY